MVMLPLAAVRRQSSSAGFQAQPSPGFQKQSASFRSPIAAAEKAAAVGRTPMVCDVEAKAVGVGAHGTVRRARLVSDGRRCVVKEVLKRSAEAEAAARREAEMLGRLSHGSICQLLGAFEDDRAIYLVLEYVDGRDLLDELAEAGGAPMDEVRVAHIARQVFEALEYMHEPGRSMLHRDLKPENVMIRHDALSEDGVGVDTVKLIDFGLAMPCRDTVRTSVVGTPGYIAPESLERGAYSRASDMWSAGAMLHMLLTGGVPPRLCRSEDGRISLDSSPLEEAGVSMAARVLVQRLLAARPQDRPTAAEAAAYPWVAQAGRNCSCPAPLLGCPSPAPTCPVPAAHHCAGSRIAADPWPRTPYRGMTDEKASDKLACVLNLAPEAWDLDWDLDVHDVFNDADSVSRTPSLVMVDAHTALLVSKGRHRTHKERCGHRQHRLGNARCRGSHKLAPGADVGDKENRRPS